MSKLPEGREPLSKEWLREKDMEINELLLSAIKEGRKAERRAIVNYLRTKGTVISRVLGNDIEDGGHLREDDDVHD